MCRGSLHDGRVIEMQSFVPKRSNVSRWSHLDVKRKLCLDVLGQTRLKLNFDRIRHYVFGLRNAFPLSVDHHPGGSGKKKYLAHTFCKMCCGTSPDGAILGSQESRHLT